MNARTLFRGERRRFCAAVRSFIESEALPGYGRFREQGYVDRDTWRKAGASGLLCATFPQTLADAQAEKLHRVVLLEEFGRAGMPELLDMLLQSGRAASLIGRHGSGALKWNYLPRMASGELIGALAESELQDVSAPSDQHITAVRMGEHYVVNGVKRCVPNGHQADLVILVAVDPSRCADSASLLVVDTAMPGFSKGPRAGDPGGGSFGRADLHFDKVPVPVENLLCADNAGRLRLE